MDAYKNKRGEQLKPQNVGPRTRLLVSPDKATKERTDSVKSTLDSLHHIYKNL